MLRLIAPDFLIIYDFALKSLVATQPSDIYEVIIERHRRTSTIVNNTRLCGALYNRFVVTDRPENAQKLNQEIYGQRGEMENRIKEQQLGLFADCTSCHAILANQFRLLLSSAAYVLFDALCSLGCPERN
jgi:hypothetical protein